jgi:pectinesterase
MEIPVTLMRSLPLLCVCFLGFAVWFVGDGLAWADEPASQPPAPVRTGVRIVLAGDSTVTDKAGWGVGFARCLSPQAECLNLARGGRSSKSFIAEGLWKKCLDARPDYILIQFGHNDQPGHPGDRQTDPNTTYRQYMTQYVDDARAAGIKPILVTSISRRQWGWDGKIHSSLLPYVEVVKQIAGEKGVPLIDLHARSIEVYEKLGKKKCYEFSPRKGDGYDNTHLNAKGSDIFGPIVAEELVKAVPELAPFVSPSGYQVSARTVTVAADGSGDFRTLQDAIATVAHYSPARTTLHIKPGIYQGQLILQPDKSNVTFAGDDPATTLLTYALNVQDPVPPGESDKFKGTGVVILADGFHAENVTFQNTSGDHGQALALRINGDRAVLRHCRLLGWQDTLRVSENRQYFKDCYIEGRVDFIYGAATAVFDRCEIHSKNGGFVTAASTPKEQPFGLVFLDCKLTGDPNPWVDPSAQAPPKPSKTPLAYLGRPWRPFAAVTFIRCEMGDHIRPEGWHNWGKPDSEKTARYAEFESTGPGANPSARVPWSRQLTAKEAAKITVQSVLGGADGWNPSE